MNEKTKDALSHYAEFSCVVTVVILQCLQIWFLSLSGSILQNLHALCDASDAFLFLLQERESVKRDLQRWLRKTKAPKALTQPLGEVVKGYDHRMVWMFGVAGCLA